MPGPISDLGNAPGEYSTIETPDVGDAVESLNNAAKSAAKWVKDCFTSDTQAQEEPKLKVAQADTYSRECNPANTLHGICH